METGVKQRRSLSEVFRVFRQQRTQSCIISLGYTPVSHRRGVNNTIKMSQKKKEKKEGKKEAFGKDPKKTPRFFFDTRSSSSTQKEEEEEEEEED